MDKALSVLFDGSDGEQLFELNLDGVQTCMTPFQIQHFVLNRQEFTTDFAQFQQAKLELYQRQQIFYDLYYQYRKAQAEIKLFEAENEELQKQPDGKIKEAKLELKQIEVDKSQWQLASIKKQAADKLREALVFLKTYTAYKKFDKMKQEELAKYEEESWRIKSAYYSELKERYGLTPTGFLQLPHERGGLKALIEQENLRLKEAKERG